MKKTTPDLVLDEKDKKAVSSAITAPKATTKKTTSKSADTHKLTKETKAKTTTKTTATEAAAKTARAPRKTTTKKDASQTGEIKKELTYKGLPLVRLGNDVYYGDPSEKYVVKLTALESEKWEDLEIATKVSVELISTINHNVCKKKSEKDSLYHALDIGQIWLKRILSEEAS
ncbi:MAG: hypothetical protein LBB04_01535 [Oscillospiraceae bacterium]|jgi:hypothetical protein|nr:hypothetical protein [Oscillospiraceae bacterium]